MKRRALLSVITAALAAAAPAFAASEGSWTGDFGIPSFDGPTRACAVFQGRYVVGGDFQWASGTPASNVAVWHPHTFGIAGTPGTGEDWIEVGGGLPSPARRLAVWGPTLLAGTDSYFPGSTPVMQYEGSTWHPLGAGLYGEVDAILPAGPTVYAAGMLLVPGSTNDYRVVRWTGSAWQQVGGTFDARVRALALHEGELYAAGEFLFAEDTFVSRIARWDGAHWVGVGGGTGTEANIAALASFQGRLVAGGIFHEIGGVAANGIATWDGSAWSGLPNTPADAFVQDLETEGRVLHVAGVLQVSGVWAAGLVTFDGQDWTPPSTYPGWGIEDVSIGDGALIAVGHHADLLQGTPPTTYIQTRDVLVRDTQWHDLVAWRPAMRGLRGPSNTSVSALRVHSGALYAGGYFHEAAHPPGWEPAEGVARWDGDGWQPLAGGLRGWVLELESWEGLLIVGGSYFFSPTGSSSVMGWNGSTWSDLGSPLEGYVGGLAVWQGALVAVGQLKLPGDPTYHGVMVHRGSGWVPLGAPLVGDHTSIKDVAVYGSDLFVGGFSLQLPGSSVESIAFWNGNAWEAVVGSPFRSVNCLAALDDGLWVGGDVSSRRVPSNSAVWRWNDGWTEIGGLAGSVNQILPVDGRVFAGGYLYAPGGQSVVATWDGENWIGLPDAPNAAVRTMARLGRDVFVGGDFTRAGGHAAEAIARWTMPVASLGTGKLSIALAAKPNPATDQVSFRFTLVRGGRVRITIHDLRGALVARPVDEVLTAGPVERKWSTSGGDPIPPGVYFARVTAPEGQGTTRVVVVEKWNEPRSGH